MEGTIGKWLKQPGDTIQRYDPLVEVVTDKVTMDMPSPVAGTLLRILAQEGDVVPWALPSPKWRPTKPQAESPSESVAVAAPPVPAAPVNPGTTGYLIRDQRPVGPTGGGPGGQPPGSDAASPESAPQPPTRNRPGCPRRCAAWPGSTA